MADADVPAPPAYSRDSTVLRLPGAVSLDDLSPQWAWGGATGKGVRVAIIDSGIEAGHPALGGSVDLEGSVRVELAGGDAATVVAAPPRDSYGHGTACAEIVHRLAPEASLSSIRVLGPSLGGRAAAFLKGLAWAIEQGFDIVNLSLGTYREDWALAFYELCDLAYFRNCFVVTAANNVARPSFPSMYGSVASVACNTATDPFRFHYNPDPPTEFLARGIDIDVAWLDGGRIRATGNSFAAPHIAGVAALIRSKHATLRPFQLKTVLWATAANVRESTGRPIAAGRLSRTMRRATVSPRATTALRL